MSAPIELSDDELDAAGGKTFTAPVLGLLALMAVIGAVFGSMLASTTQVRDVRSARAADAQRILEALRPKLDALNEASKVVGSLKAGDPKFEAVSGLADVDIAPDGNLLGGNRLLLSPVAIDHVTDFTVDAAVLENMIEEHVRLTTKAERDDLDEAASSNKTLLEGSNFAVMFDYQHLRDTSGREDYQPKLGSLVEITDLKRDEEDKITAKLVGGREVKTILQGVIPVRKEQLMKSGGETALARHDARVRALKEQVQKIEAYQEQLTSELQKLADLGEAPLFSF